MINRSKVKVEMPERDPKERVLDFKEVALGYTPEQAIEEARRCLQCRDKPCVDGCPVRVPIPGFIELVAQGDFKAAYQLILTANRLPAICGRVCPQEVQCEQVCIRAKAGEPVAIGRLERFVADWGMAQGIADQPVEPTGQPVAVIGSGPAGLACAGELSSLGYPVTIFEAFHVAGGVLMYGIPEFRLPKQLVQEEIRQLEDLGVMIRKNQVIGKIYSVDELKEEGFAAIFIGSGAGLPTFLNIPGENLNGVMSANEFLTRVNLMQAYRYPEVDTPVYIGERVAVIGGGNVAMDAARSARRLGAERVTVLYRRTAQEMPARQEEVEHARQEGIEFSFLVNPLAINGTEDGWVDGIVCERMSLAEADASGRRRPVPIPDSSFTQPVDMVIVAIGQTPNPLLKATTPGLETRDWGGIITDPETMATSVPGVYAGGDAVSGAATVIQAMGAGKRAAHSIDQYLQESAR